MVLVVKSVADDLTQCARPLVIIVQVNIYYSIFKKLGFDIFNFIEYAVTKQNPTFCLVIVNNNAIKSEIIMY